jgi:hypothetical protein
MTALRIRRAPCVACAREFVSIRLPSDRNPPRAYCDHCRYQRTVWRDQKHPTKCPPAKAMRERLEMTP